MKARWNNELIAESDNTIIVENNHYFPFDAVNYFNAVSLFLEKDKQLI